MNDRRHLLMTAEEIKKIGGKELTNNTTDIIKILYIPLLTRSVSGRVSFDLVNLDGSGFTDTRFESGCYMRVEFAGPIIYFYRNSTNYYSYKLFITRKDIPDNDYWNNLAIVTPTENDVYYIGIILPNIKIASSWSQQNWYLKLKYFNFTAEKLYYETA